MSCKLSGLLSVKWTVHIRRNLERKGKGLAFRILGWSLNAQLDFKGSMLLWNVSEVVSIEMSCYLPIVHFQLMQLYSWSTSISRPGVKFFHTRSFLSLQPTTLSYWNSGTERTIIIKSGPGVDPVKGPGFYGSTRVNSGQPGKIFKNIKILIFHMKNLCKYRLYILWSLKEYFKKFFIPH